MEMLGPDDGGGALQLIAVLEGIRDCGNAADVMQDPEGALRLCLAARDEYKILAIEPKTFSDHDEEVAEIFATHARTALDRVAAEATIGREHDRLDKFASILS